MRRFDWRIESRIHEDGSIQPTDAIMEPSDELRFTIDYPLTKPFRFRETHADGSGWSEKQFVDAVHRAYAKVYRDEGPDPGRATPLVNRARSYGPYGIYGHDLCDLWLDSADRQQDGTWRLVVTS